MIFLTSNIIHNNECRTLLYGNHCFCETFSDYKTLCRLQQHYSVCYGIEHF